MKPLRLLAALACALTPSAFAAVQAVPIGDPSLQFQAKGAILVENLDTEMGTLKASHSVRTVPQKGDELTFEVPFDAGAKTLILEIQEIHNRRAAAYGYTVLINGHAVYFRTYQELGAGPNHFFVEAV